jgi:hypothetical protein
MGCAMRVYTAGHRLRMPATRAALLKSSSLVRLSVDAATEATYVQTHGVSGLEHRLAGFQAMAEERTAERNPLLGMHFVIQRENRHEITRFAEMARERGADFVVFGQETFGKTAGGFDADDYANVVAQLRDAEAMHDDGFAVVVPRLVHRQTIVEFDKGHFADAAELNLCHNSKHRIFFGVQNDFSACWLATLDEQFRRESHVGSLADDKTMETVNRIIGGGVGEAFPQGAHLSCNRCVAGNYNSMVDSILRHLRGEQDFHAELVQHAPGAQVYDEGYEFLLVGADKQTLGSKITLLPLPTVRAGAAL